MRKFLIAAAAGLTVVVAGSLTAPRAGAIPLASPPGVIDEPNMVEQVAFCFYADGWNGPGMYECGYRHRHGKGWHGPREGRERSGERHDEGRHGDGRNDEHRGTHADLRKSRAASSRSLRFNRNPGHASATIGAFAAMAPYRPV
jgi:hypothetical protein